MQCTHYVPALTITMGNYSVTYHFFVVDVPDTNVVKGVQWLYSLGRLTTDWRKLEMEFTGSDGKLDLLRGMHSYPPQTVSAHMMEVNLGHGDIEWVVELRVSEARGHLGQVPYGVWGQPPDRGFEHTIELEPRPEDDILIYSSTWEEHLQHVETVLHILEEQQFYTRLSKCEFSLMEMLYLGNIIGEDNVRVHEEKIRAIRDWPEPQNVTELRVFVGICTYYLKFLKGFSQLAAPPIHLTKKGVFKWTDGVQ
eukprot:PITA_36261